jgi:predicted Zn finger-like uncharacterized protein
MVTFKTTCPGCNATFKVDDSHLGRNARCARCGARFKIESTRAGAAPSTPTKQRRSEAASAGTPGLSAEEKVPAQWNVGDVILDLYEVTGVLGEGGMGKVYKVHHRGWNLDLAVKCPKPDYFKTAPQKETFTAECETWIKLGLHPHIVSCYYVRTLGGIPRVFAEYVEGGTLKEWITSGKLYEGGPDKALERILDIAIQFAWGLHYAHEHEEKLIHQDVKPANVMLTPDGIAKVTDFGLAKARAAAGEVSTADRQQSILVRSGGMTPAYCSPEQANKEGLSRKADIWSWAVSILEMFTGDVTWPSGSVAGEALQGYLEVGSGDERIPRMPEAVVELLRCCFQRDPPARPKDLHEAAETLREAYVAASGGQPYSRQEPKAAALLASALNNRALSLLDLGKQQEAQRTWRQALAADAHHLESVYNLGLFEWRAARIDDVTVVRRLREAGTTSSAPWRAALLKAQVEMERGDCEAALRLLNGLGSEDQAQPEIRALFTCARERLPTSRRLLRTFTGHTDRVNSVFLSADGLYALSGSNDCTLKLWELASGRCLRTFEVLRGSWESVHAVFLSADGSYALSGSADNRLRLWEVANGQCLQTFEGHTDCVHSVFLGADGSYALSGSADKTLRLWDVANGRCLQTFEGHTDCVHSVFLSADGRYALSGSSDTTLRFWDVYSGTCLKTFGGHTSSVNSVFLSADGRYALSGSSDPELFTLVAPVGYESQDMGKL